MDAKRSAARNIILSLAIGLTLGLGVGRVTAPRDASVVSSTPSEIRFPVGDVSRDFYWALAGLHRLVVDTFDRSEPVGLGVTGTGDGWVIASGEWTIADHVARLKQPAPNDAPNVAVVPHGEGDGIMEVTMTAVEPGAGLVFRYADPANYWAITAVPSAGSWTLSRRVEGIDEVVADVPGPTTDGTTVTIIQTGATMRVLLDGSDYLSLSDRTFARQLQAGLIAPAGSRGTARWDRFLTMTFAVTSNGGSSGN